MIKFKKTPLKLTLLAILVVVNLILFSYLFFLGFYQQKIFPGIKVAGINISGQTSLEAKNTLQTEFKNRVENPLKLNYQDQTFTLNLTAASPKINIEDKVNEAYVLGRTGNYIQDFKDQMIALTMGIDFKPEVIYQSKLLLNSQLIAINQSIKKDPVNAQIVFGEAITITPSEDGQAVDNQTLLKQVGDYLSLTSQAPIVIPVKITNPKFTTENAQTAQKALENLKNSPVKLVYNQNSWTLDQPTLYSLLDLTDTQIEEELTENETVSKNIVEDKTVHLNPKKVENFLQAIAQKIDQNPQDARFEVDSPGNKQVRVREFKSAQEGRKLNLEQTKILITQALGNNSTKEILLPVEVAQPKITNAEVNSLGINTLLGQGVSNFSGSIENRIFNVGLAASRINGVLIAPGETFSFLDAVGDISGATGYKPAYVIKSGRTVLDDGGGVCQVSTTLFRAILNSGLPVVERTAHAYRVGYYEQGFPPGLDATVFSPTVDLKFKNDTSAHILIQSYMVGTTLYMDLYGSSDGRVSNLTVPKIYNQTPPPPELRQDDPTLPRGQVKQVDWSAWGANVSFDRTVTRNGETLISETFKSNYKPWQAVYLVGTKD